MPLSATDFLRRRPRAADPTPSAPPEAYLVQLPSRGLLYPTRTAAVQMSPFTIGQVKTLKTIRPGATNPAEAERITVAAMARSIHGMDPLDMTEGDFRYCMYWARINSFGPYTLTLRFKWPGSDEVTVHKVTQRDLEPLSLDTARPIDHRWGPLTMRDKIGIVDIDDPTEQWVATHAAYLIDGALQDKMVRLEAMSLTDLSAIRAHMIAIDHGVREFTTVTREREGQQEALDVELQLDISDFFPKVPDHDLFMQQDELMQFRGHYFGDDTVYLTLVKHHHQLIRDLEAKRNAQDNSS